MKQKQKPNFALVVKPGGEIAGIYSDELTPLFAEGDVTITRASHVEPTPSGNWIADMGPAVKRYRVECDNPILGPFTLRGDALAAEVAWLETHVLGAGI